MTQVKPEITINRVPHGSGFRLLATQFLPKSRETLFEFFSDAHQLETITPPWLRFEVLAPAPLPITENLLIDYRLRLHGISLRWQSRISVWEPPVRFVDEQVRGPYRYWRHEHYFEPVDGGTLCRDTVDYAVPGGRIIHALFVGPDLQRIFAFRQQKLAQLFGQASPSGNIANT